MEANATQQSRGGRKLKDAVYFRDLELFGIFISEFLSIRFEFFKNSGVIPRDSDLPGSDCYEE
jgi:hypothetical protein